MNALSYQLYSSRNFGPLADTFSMLAAAGYTHVEGYGALFAGLSDVSELRASLDTAGLIMASGHVGLDAIEADADSIVSVAQQLGMRAVYAPYLQEADRPTDAAGWRALGGRLEMAGAALRAAGLNFGWHNHDFELVALPTGEIPLDLIFEGGPSLQWEADLAWVVRGGADLAATIARHRNRITAVHVKDIAPAGEALDEDGWADPGHGVMDWAGLVKLLVGAPVAHWIVEHDNPSDDARFATRAAATLREIWA